MVGGHEAQVRIDEERLQLRGFNIGIELNHGSRRAKTRIVVRTHVLMHGQTHRATRKKRENVRRWWQDRIR